MEAALLALLRADPAVAAAAPGGLDWWRHPQPGAAPGPYAVLFVISDQEETGLQAPSGLSRARVQIDAYAQDYLGAATLSRALRHRLSGHSDRRFPGIFFAARRDLDSGDRGLARISTDFHVTFYRSFP